MYPMVYVSGSPRRLCDQAKPQNVLEERRHQLRCGGRLKSREPMNVWFFVKSDNLFADSTMTTGWMSRKILFHEDS